LSKNKLNKDLAVQVHTPTNLISTATSATESESFKNQ